MNLKKIKKELNKINSNLNKVNVQDLEKLGLEILQPNKTVVVLDGLCFYIHEKTINLKDPQGHVHGVYDNWGCVYRGTRSQCEDWQEKFQNEDFPTEIERDFLWG